MELENMAANAADTAPAETGGADTSAVGSAAAPSGSSGAEQDVSQTKAFSRRLNEMSAQRTDAAISSLGMTNPYTNTPISTLAELREFNAMRDADESGGDPESAGELSRLRAQVAEFEQREREAGLRQQESAINADPARAPYFAEYRDEITSLMEASAAQGMDIDLDTALATIMATHYSDIRAKDIERAKAEALASVQANAAASPGSVSGAPAGDHLDWRNMSDAEFERHLAIAKRGGYRKS